MSGRTVQSGITVDIREFLRATEKLEFSARDTKACIEAGASVIEDAQRKMVPVDTGATKRSIHSEVTADKGVGRVEVGPTTHYAPYIEYGTSNPNYPVQPFVVPSAVGRNKLLAIEAIWNATRDLIRRKLR